MFERLRRSLTGKTTRHQVVVNQNMTSTVASASVVKRDSDQSASAGMMRTADWQELCWLYNDKVTYFEDAVRRKAATLGRCRLVTARIEPGGEGDPEPLEPGHVANIPLEELRTVSGGTSQLLTRATSHLDIIGETWFVGADDEAGNRLYRCATPEEFITRSGRRFLRVDTDREIELQPGQYTLSRFWREHKRYSWEADSPGRRSLVPLAQIVGCDNFVEATLDSRLAGRGILFIDEQASMTTPGEEGLDLHDDPFMAAMMTAMLSALKDRDNASAVIPLLVKTSAEAIKNIKHLDLSTDVSQNIVVVKDSALRALGAGLDIPANMVTGQGGGNHWSDWLQSETFIDSHAEPTLALLCDAFTHQFLRPALEEFRVPNPEQYVIWYDLSPIVARPDKRPESIVLYDRDLLDGVVVVEEHGYTKDQMPDPAQIREKRIWELTLKRPELAEQLLPELGIALEPATLAVPSSRPVPELPSPPPTDEGGSTRNEIPERQLTPPAKPSASARATTQSPIVEITKWQVKAAEIVAVRALELAGKRLLSQVNRAARRDIRGFASAPSVPEWLIHTQLQAPSDSAALDHLLDKAFILADALLAEQPCIRRTVEEYVRALLVAQVEHRHDLLRDALSRAGCVITDAGGP